jgi:Acetyltransferase (GNAT) domain
VSDYFPCTHRPGLFRSQAWLDAWQIAWGDHSAITRAAGSARPLAFSESPLTLAAPYTYIHIIKKILPVKTGFPLGISTSAAPSIRSEYFVLPGAEAMAVDLAARNFIQQIAKCRWQQFYIPDLLDASADYSALARAAAQQGWRWVVIDKNTSYGIVAKHGSFHSYLTALGANTRLKLFNRRKNLAALGAVEINNIWPDKKYFLALINAFHQQRWGKPCYQGRNENFIGLLLDGLARAGHHINLSLMTVAGEPVSVLLDVTINGRVYNLQSGYIENFAKNIALGTLHLGYQIEAAFTCADVDFYDFMAGKGKNANYKAALANTSAQFNSIMLVRNPMLKWLYRLQGYCA